MILSSKLRPFLTKIIQRLREFPIPLGKTALELAGFSTEKLAEELATRIKTMPGSPMNDIFYRHGFHLLRKHFYLPIPDDGDDLDTFWERPSSLAGIDMNEAAAKHLMDEVLPPYLTEFRKRFSIEKPTDVSEKFWLINGGYMAVDAHVLYGLARHYKPKRIIEIGNGNSTLLAIEAAKENRIEGHTTEVISIDPYPWDLFRNGYPGLSELIVKPVQKIPTSFFGKLDKNDILFIDSSHVIRSGNDVHYEYLEILPRLAPGVMVHIHDISLPKPYPKVYYDNHLYWNEQYLLQAFLAFNNRFEVLWPGNYMMLKEPEKMLSVFPEIDIMRKSYPSSEPTAFWIRIKSN
ncbi:MAG: class I SAM-dependent methyltransferase [Desulfobacula sp.]|nr:class I SAM-dependent methyltransferase [Desulfobacula sp.]